MPPPPLASSSSAMLHAGSQQPRLALCASCVCLCLHTCMHSHVPPTRMRAIVVPVTPHCADGTSFRSLTEADVSVVLDRCPAAAARTVGAKKRLWKLVSSLQKRRTERALSTYSESPSPSPPSPDLLAAAATPPSLSPVPLEVCRDVCGTVCVRWQAPFLFPWRLTWVTFFVCSECACVLCLCVCLVGHACVLLCLSTTAFICIDGRFGYVCVSVRE